MELKQVIDAWRLAPDSDFGPPLAAGAIESAERLLGRPLPTGLVALYSAGDGLSVVGGNLSINAVSGDMALPGQSERLREWGWPIPAEVLIFGTNGGGDQFGLWYPEGAGPMDPMPVVHVGSIFEPGCMALVGTDLPRFLLAWTAFYALVTEAPPAVLDALDLPMSLRVAEPDSLAPYFRWADPDLPNHDPDPYADRLDAGGIARLVGRTT